MTMTDLRVPPRLTTADREHLDAVRTVTTRCPSWCAGTHRPVGEFLEREEILEHESTGELVDLVAVDGHEHPVHVALSSWQDEQGLTPVEVRLWLPEDGVSMYLTREHLQALVDALSRTLAALPATPELDA